MTNTAPGEDGSKLWLRYEPLRGRAPIDQFVVEGRSPTYDAIAAELALALPEAKRVESASSSRTIVVRKTSTDLGGDGFSIRSTAGCVVIAAQTDIGCLYGTFALLRRVQTGQPIDSLDISERPKQRRRMLDHWDNLDGSIERGYAGQSLWKWDELHGKLSPRYVAYARAMASIGLNGVVLNNVNAKADSLSADFLKKTAVLANVFRPYGVRVYLSANFAAPKSLGKLDTADPRDAKVAAWWKAKADEIYALIPDFGGFVVKANSEGQPGPQDYGRTHADGANVLADALAPHGGIVMWRAFVYDEGVDPDRAKRAYIEFTRLDGKFRKNVIVQVKNGPIDFMPREPFHPLFGAMKQTPVMAELQVTQEYLGHSNHLVYLAPMWKEFLDFDTHARGAGTPVSSTIDGICAVANTGDDANWCGHHFAQANWYAFGRLAWDSSLSAAQIADEWVRMTFSADEKATATVQEMMLGSWETFISYSMPLGLHHLISGNHYAPAPWNAREPREDWTAVYYHRADAKAIGFDRTMRGNGAVGQYAPAVRDLFDALDTCPQKFLLWFHRLPWDHRLASGRTLWEQLCAEYQSGSARAMQMEAAWQALEGRIDPERHRAVAEKLAIQSRDAAEWRDKCLSYFQTLSRMPIPKSPAPR